MHTVVLFCVLVVVRSVGGSVDWIHDSCQDVHWTKGPPNLSSLPVTVTPSGPIRGSWLYTRRGRPVEAYRGIRFAAPPVGHLRFQPPQLIKYYEGEVNATVEGPLCPQPPAPVTGDYFVDEDCLRINVYTPGKASGCLPVLVFLHGGAFHSGSGRSDIFGPHYMLDRDIVLVAFNYRVASLGFLSTGDKHSPGNNGFKDQVAALRWVKRNIAAFGGDPGCVTVSGTSAGASSVSLLMVSPMAKGLFHRAISTCSSAISQVAFLTEQKDVAIKQAKLHNCSTENSKAMLDCLRTKTAQELGNSRNQFFEFGLDPILIWKPVIEEDFGQERFLTEHPVDSIRHGRFHAVPYLISMTQDELFARAFLILNDKTLTHEMDTDWHRIAPISFNLPEPSRRAADTLRHYYLGGHNNGSLVNDNETAVNLGKLYSDAFIGFVVHSLVNLMAKYNPECVYYYEFAHVGNTSLYMDPDTRRPAGSAHGDDMLYLFPYSTLFPLIEVSPSLDSCIVDRMTAIWYNFMRFGDPNPTHDTPEITFWWPRMTHARRRYLRIDAGFSVRENFNEHRYQVWERLYNPKNCTYCTY